MTKNASALIVGHHENIIKAIRLRIMDFLENRQSKNKSVDGKIPKSPSLSYPPQHLNEYKHFNVVIVPLNRVRRQSWATTSIDAYGEHEQQKKR